MDKKNIKKHLTSTFLSEDKKPVGLSNTEKVQADSKKFNNANQKEVAKEMKGYEKSLEKGTEPVKYENGKKEEEFQDLASYNQGSIINLKPDNDPGEAWVEKNKQAITGKNSTQGNCTEYANVIPEDQAGFTGPKFNENLYKSNVEFNNKVKKSRKAQDARIGVNVNSDTNDNYLKENKKSKMKRLVFKKEFKGVGNALNLIPETYKVNGKQFHMTDGNEKYEIRWEGSLTEGRAIVLKASDKNLMNEDMENMKRLMGYKSQDTLGTVKGAARLDENKKFTDIWGKTKNIMTEMTSGYGFSNEGNLEGMNEYNVDEESNKNRQQQISNQRKIEKDNREEEIKNIVKKHVENNNVIYGYNRKEEGKRANETRKIYRVIEINPNAPSIRYPIEVKFGSSHYRTHLLMISPNNIATESFLIDEDISKKSFDNILSITKDAIGMSELSNTDKQLALNNVVNKFKKHIKEDIPNEEIGMYEYGLSEQWNPDESYTGPFFTASFMDEPGEGRLHVISDVEVDEYQGNGWDIEGPMSYADANDKMVSFDSSNKQFSYLSGLDDRDVERDEMNYNRGGKTPSHVSAMNQYDADKRDRAQQISKRKLRGGDDW